jgi:hypothetical protein
MRRLRCDQVDERRRFVLSRTGDALSDVWLTQLGAVGIVAVKKAYESGVASTHGSPSGATTAMAAAAFPALRPV